MKQAVQITIQGQSFSLKTDLPVAQVEEIADFVNTQIGQIVGSDGSVDTYRAVVLALLNVAGLYLQKESTPRQEQEGAPEPHQSQRLEQLVARLEEALQDPQGKLDF